MVEGGVIVNRYDAVKILNKDIQAITRNKKAYSVDFSPEMAIDRWRNRIVLFDKNKKYLTDPRLQKAAFLLTSAALGSKYSLKIKDNTVISPKEAAVIYRHIFKAESLAELLEDVPEDASGIVFEEVAKSIENKKHKELMLEVALGAKKVNKMLKEINKLQERINIYSIIFKGIKDAVLFGDDFYEVVYDKQNVLSVDSLNFTKVLPYYNSKGVITYWTYDTLLDTKMIKFYPYQILRFNFNPDDLGVGQGLFFLTLNINRFAHRFERLMSIGRESRSVQIRLHYPNYEDLPDAYKRILTKDEVKSHKREVEQSLKAGYVVDIFSNGLYKVDTLKSDGALFNDIKDVELIHTLFEIGLLLPTGIIDSGKAVDRATMDLQIKFLKGLLKVLCITAEDAISQLIKTQLFLHGYDLDNLSININFDKAALIDVLEASQIVSRLNNKYNNFPAPILADFMGISWEDYTAAIKQAQQMNVYNAPEDKK